MRQCDEYYYEGEGQEGRRVREWFCASPHAAARSRSRPPAALSIALSMLSAASARVRPAVVVVVLRLLCNRACAPQPARPAQPQQRECAPVAAHRPSSKPDATTAARRKCGVRPRLGFVCQRQQSRLQNTPRSQIVRRARRRSQRCTRQPPPRRRAQPSAGAASCGCRARPRSEQRPALATIPWKTVDASLKT